MKTQLLLIQWTVILKKNKHKKPPTSCHQHIFLGAIRAGHFSNMMYVFQYNQSTFRTDTKASCFQIPYFAEYQH